MTDKYEQEQHSTSLTVPHVEALGKLLSHLSYQLPAGQHLALVDNTTIYYFDHTTNHSGSFHYQRRKLYSDYSEYYLHNQNGQQYIVYTLMTARLLIPQLIIPDPPTVIVPVPATLTLIHQHGAVDTYPVSNRNPQWHWHDLETTTTDDKSSMITLSDDLGLLTISGK